MSEGLKKESKPTADEGTIVYTFRTSLERLAKVREELEARLTHLNQIV